VKDADGLILDLRGNPGGFFDAAVYAGNEFLAKGKVIAKQEDRNSRQDSFTVTRNGKLLKIPVVVLVDGGSASASEILAGALQKNDRAVVIGEDTYGKGTAQSVVPFDDGSSLHVTILKWLLPDGTWLNKDNTIKPDIKVEFSEESFLKGEDDQLDRAVEELK
jgi:carboxyl-terminal processing protease